MPEENNQATELKAGAEHSEIPPQKYIRALEAENAELRWALGVTFPAYEEQEKTFDCRAPMAVAFTHQFVERIRRVLTNPPEFTGMPL